MPPYGWAGSRRHLGMPPYVAAQARQPVAARRGQVRLKSYDPSLYGCVLQPGEQLTLVHAEPPGHIGGEIGFTERLDIGEVDGVCAGLAVFIEIGF